LQAGHRTTVVDMLPEIGAGANIVVILDVKERIAPCNPSYFPAHLLKKITAEGVELECLKTCQSVFVAADTVILAMGVKPRAEVVDHFKAVFPDARVLGDAVRGGRILDATQDAYGQAFVFEP